MGFGFIFYPDTQPDVFPWRMHFISNLFVKQNSSNTKQNVIATIKDRHTVCWGVEVGRRQYLN